MKGVMAIAVTVMCLAEFSALSLADEKKATMGEMKGE